MKNVHSVTNEVVADLKEAVVKLFVFFVSVYLFTFAGVAAFNHVVSLFFIGGFAGMGIFIIAVLAAYLTTFREYATLKQVVAFTAVNFLLAFPVRWLVRNTAVPDATSWGGLALHVALGVLILYAAFIVVARGDTVMVRLSPGE